MRPETARRGLGCIRALIDGADDGLLLLLASRRRLVAIAAACKDGTGQSMRDRQREADVLSRARRLGRRLGVPDASCDRLMLVLIADAWAQQGLDTGSPDLDQGTSGTRQCMLPPAMDRKSANSPSYNWLRLLPPPARLAPVLRLLPAHWQAHWLELAMERVLAAPIASGSLDALAGRRIGIEISDLGLRWVVCLRGGHMRVCPASTSAEATVRGTATDLLLLASRRDDADTLFFQRRLVLTGDVELGLTARNLLDQLPWQDVPLGLRIVLHRGAGLARSARAAHRGEAPA